MKLFAALFLLLSSIASADVVLMAGVGKSVLKANGTPFERVGVLGYQYNLPMSLFVRPQAGLFSAHGDGQQGSWWGAALLGVEAHTDLGADLSIGVGPAYLGNPDAVLGGHFQFNTEFGLGLSNKDVAIKLAWMHLSSGPIYPINLGRDFICAQVRLKVF